MHKGNRSKTGLEENLITIRDNVTRIVTLHFKGFDAEKIAENLCTDIKEVKEVIRIFEQD